MLSRFVISLHLLASHERDFIDRLYLNRVEGPETSWPVELAPTGTACKKGFLWTLREIGKLRKTGEIWETTSRGNWASGGSGAVYEVLCRFVRQRKTLCFLKKDKNSTKKFISFMMKGSSEAC